MQATGKVSDRQPEGVDQTRQPNPDKMGRGQTCLAFAVTQCVDHVSPTTTTQSRDSSDLVHSVKTMNFDNMVPERLLPKVYIYIGMVSETGTNHLMVGSDLTWLVRSVRHIEFYMRFKILIGQSS